MPPTKALLKWLDGTTTTTNIDEKMSSIIERNHPADGDLRKLKATNDVLMISGETHDVYVEVVPDEAANAALTN